MPRKEREVEQQPEDVEQQNDEEPIKNMTCPEFDVERLYFRAMEMNPEAAQLTCFPKYLYPDEENDLELTSENFEKHGEQAILVTQPIKIVRGGIPKFNSQFHTDGIDSMKRAYFWIPKNSEDPNSMELFDCIQRIDDYMFDEINTKKNNNAVICVLNKKKKRVALRGITYTRMITTAKPGSDLEIDDDDDDDNKGKKKNTNKNNKKEFIPWERIKARFATLYDENLKPDDQKEITTQVYVGTKEDPENCKTVSEVEKHFMWGCTAQFALVLNKVWIQKTEDKKCSIGIKCIQIGVTEQPEYKRSNTSKQLNRRLFGSVPNTNTAKSSANDDDDDGDRQNTKKSSSNKKSPKGTPKRSPAKKQTSNKKNRDRDEEDEDNEDNNNEDNESQNEDSEDNQNDDENNSASESEPESESEEEQTKKKKSPSTKNVKVKGKTEKQKTPVKSVQKKQAAKKGK